MHPFLVTVCLTLLLCAAYLRGSRNIAAKNWLLPATSAALAAVIAACFATFAAPTLSVGYAVGMPLGLSAGCLLHHLFQHCHSCGVTPPVGQSLQGLPRHDAEAQRCAHCRKPSLRQPMSKTARGQGG